MAVKNENSSIIPPMYRVQQLFDSREIEDVGKVIEAEFSSLDLSERVQPGQRVAVAVGFCLSLSLWAIVISCSPTACVMLLNTHKPLATSQQECRHETPLKSS